MIPVGWPNPVADPDDPRFVESAVAWMLDQGPGEWRAHGFWREHPQALAHRLLHDIEARREGARNAYSSVRVSLSDSDVDIDRALAAIEEEGAHLAARAREAELIADALAGRRWRGRL